MSECGILPIRMKHWRIRLLFCLLCLGVVCQILGSPVSFSGLDGSHDIEVVTQLMEEDLSVLSDSQFVPIFYSVGLLAHLISRQHRYLGLSDLFHPPRL